MSNLEHLVENGLGILENGYSSEEWFNRMSADINWEYVENITVDDLWEICQYVFYTWSKILIDSAPTIDAVSVVRCKDCKHRYEDGEHVKFNVCELNHNKVQSDDWFCADGERKDQ